MDAMRSDARTGRRWVGLAWRIVRAVLVAYLLAVLAAMLLERSLVYFPAVYPSGNWEPQGLPIEDAWFTAADGTRLHGWYVPHEQPVAVVLFCHGNAGNVTHRIDLLRQLHHRVGASVLVFDYRGYGRSEGTPDEEGILADARAARRWLARRAGVAQEEIVLLGRSLGGAVAVDLAANDGAAALVLQSTFSSAADVAAYHFPWLPVHWLMRTRFDSAAKIGAYHGPILASHGTADRTVPFEFGRRLFDAANEPKRWITVDGGGHDDRPTPKYLQALHEFFDGLRPQPPAGTTPVSIEQSLIFFPDSYPEGDWHPPGLEFEDAWFTAADGTRLHGWYLPCKRPKARILFSHGNAGNVTHRADAMRMLQQVVGASVLIYDYRGYGRSEGRPDEPGILADARAARAWLARREGVAETEIVQMGRSLGGAVAVDLAAADGAHALVVESSSTSMPDVAAHHYPLLPVRLLMRTRLDSLSKITHYHGPLLVSHGTADSIVPYHLGRKLFEAANEPKEFFEIPGGDHNDFPPREYYEKLISLLDGLNHSG